MGNEIRYDEERRGKRQARLGSCGAPEVRQVLVVDDEAAIRQSLRGVLSDDNYEVGAVESGEACLAELDRSSYEVVLLDIWMKGLDGLATLARIQERPVPDRPAVIMISSA